MNPVFLIVIFALATGVGYVIIKNVPSLLHTPLMSLTNAISSVSVVAALIVMAEPKNRMIMIFATIAVALAATNVISGFMITERILRMFRKDQGGDAK